MDGYTISQPLGTEPERTCSNSSDHCFVQNSGLHTEGREQGRGFVTGQIKANVGQKSNPLTYSCVAKKLHITLNIDSTSIYCDYYRHFFTKKKWNLYEKINHNNDFNWIALLIIRIMKSSSVGHLILYRSSDSNAKLTAIVYLKSHFLSHTQKNKTLTYILHCATFQFLPAEKEFHHDRSR